MSTCLLCLGVILVTIQCCRSQLSLCEEYVANLIVVPSCPKSKEEWDKAAREKNCSKRAAELTCAASEKFKYHCVLNGYRNALVEVCAPERLILGHCTEFNVIGRVIQDHRKAPCKNGSFPNCDKFYWSTDAYKYPDCYDLIQRPHTPRKKPTVNNHIWLIIVAAVAVVILVLILFVCLWRKHSNVQMRDRQGRGSVEIAFTRTSGSSFTKDQIESSTSTGSADFIQCKIFLNDQFSGNEGLSSTNCM
ncbi:uncharacterized protein [Magallana gigas]|uniref:uncharacterized protein n=1 Tax=Magallana gigas TaxID=29159 RepID=UPI003340C15B